MNRYKCLACDGNQYTSCSTAEGCIYCGHQKLEKMDKLEPEACIQKEAQMMQNRQSKFFYPSELENPTSGGKIYYLPLNYNLKPEPRSDWSKKAEKIIDAVMLRIGILTIAIGTAVFVIQYVRG